MNKPAMNKPPHRALPPPPPSGRTNLASCIVATIFLLFVAIIILIVFFTVFKPEQPKISVNAVQLPSFSVSNGTVNFTFSQYLSVTNPNRASFTHYDSSMQLIYSGSQVGFMFIPAGKIDAGRTQYMTASFSIESFPLYTTSSSRSSMDLPTTTFADGVIRLGPTFGIESKVKLAGRVKILEFFTHHVEANAGCRVSIAASDGSVLGFHC